MKTFKNYLITAVIFSVALNIELCSVKAYEYKAREFGADDFHWNHFRMDFERVWKYPYNIRQTGSNFMNPYKYFIQNTITSNNSPKILSSMKVNFGNICKLDSIKTGLFKTKQKDNYSLGMIFRRSDTIIFLTNVNKDSVKKQINPLFSKLFYSSNFSLNISDLLKKDFICTNVFLKRPFCNRNDDSISIHKNWFQKILKCYFINCDDSPVALVNFNMKLKLMLNEISLKNDIRNIFKFQNQEYRNSKNTSSSIIYSIINQN